MLVRLSGDPTAVPATKICHVPLVPGGMGQVAVCTPVLQSPPSDPLRGGATCTPPRSRISLDHAARDGKG